LHNTDSTCSLMQDETMRSLIKTMSEGTTPSSVLRKFIGSREDRKRIKQISYLKLFLAILLPATIGMAIGLITFWRYNTHYPTRGESPGWPQLPIGTILGIMGTALSFLLTFMLAWAFDGWKSAKCCMVETTALLRQIVVVLATAGPDDAEEEIDALEANCRWFCAAVVMSLKGRPNLDQTAADHETVARKRVMRAHFRIGTEIEAIKAKQVAAKKDITDVYGRAYGIHEMLLLNYKGMKRLTKQKIPPVLNGLTRGLTYMYVILLFPILLAYEFVMNLDKDDVEHEILWKHKDAQTFQGLYVGSVLVVGIYFMSLLECARVLLNPVGWDVTDVQLEDYFDPFIEDMNTIRSARKECRNCRTSFTRKMTLPVDTPSLSDIAVTFEDLTRTSISSAT